MKLNEVYIKCSNIEPDAHWCLYNKDTDYYQQENAQECDHYFNLPTSRDTVVECFKVSPDGFTVHVLIN